MPRGRNLRRLAIVAVPAALGIGALLWVLVPREPSGRAASSAQAASNGAKGTGSKVQQAFELLSGPRAENTRRIIDRYAEWARDPQAFEARALLLGGLFDEENIPVKLSSVLAAVEKDPTPPEEDPLWSHVVELLAQVWEGETLTPGLDLMVAETRPRARQALISSFAHLVNTDTLPPLTPAQSQTLTNYFIDLYGQLPQSRKPEVSTALRKIAGNDVADILLGKGQSSDDELEGQREYKRALEESQRALARASQEEAAQVHDPAETR